MLSTGLALAPLAFVLVFGGWASRASSAASRKDEDKDLAAGSQLSIVGEPKSLQLLDGESADLSCEAFGTPVPTIQWLHNGKAMRLGAASMIGQQQQQPQIEKKYSILSSPVMAEKISNLGVRTFQMSTTSSKFRIPCASKDSVGLYTCVASNGRETVTANATVGLIDKSNALWYGNECPRKRAGEKMNAEPAQIYMWTDSRMERPGVSVQLMCRAFGKPSPKIVWYENTDADGGDPNSLQLITSDDPRYSLLPNGDLLVKEMPGDVPLSMFQCKAFNQHGQDSVASMLLQITDDTSSEIGENASQLEPMQQQQQ